eukprot:GHRQ01039840.1.p2 GENE.GHRQ01039840.1~~GHRQ01039840.1.p2  ORF type:complete len:102 (-),score=13.74 GHRQ01039840.1:146-451(-)
MCLPCRDSLWLLLPAGETLSESYDTEYSTDKIEMHTGAINAGQRVVLVRHAACKPVLQCVAHVQCSTACTTAACRHHLPAVPAFQAMLCVADGRCGMAHAA